MSLIDILVSGAGGGIFGSLLHCVTDWIDTKNKIALMKAQVDAAEKTEAWKAFQASQMGANESLVIPQNVPAWVASFYVCVDGFKQITRPALTWAAVVIVAMVYLKASPEVRTSMGPEIIFASFTAIFWWFGARYAKNK